VLHVTKQLKRVEDTADGSTGQTGVVGDLDNATAFVMAFEAFEDTQAAGEGENEAGVAGVRAEFVVVVVRMGIAFRVTHF
jgi:hypothetical protein